MENSLIKFNKLTFPTLSTSGHKYNLDELSIPQILAQHMKIMIPPLANGMIVAAISNPMTI